MSKTEQVHTQLTNEAEAGSTTAEQTTRRKFLERSFTFGLGALAATAVGGIYFYGKSRTATPAVSPVDVHNNVARHVGQTAEQQLEAQRQTAIADVNNYTSVLTQRIIDTPGQVTRIEDGIGSTTLIVNRQEAMPNQPGATYKLETIYGVDEQGKFINGSVDFLQASDAMQVRSEAGSIVEEITATQTPGTRDWTVDSRSSGYPFTTASAPTQQEVQQVLQNIDDLANHALTSVPAPIQ